MWEDSCLCVSVSMSSSVKLNIPNSVIHENLLVKFWNLFSHQSQEFTSGLLLVFQHGTNNSIYNWYAWTYTIDLLQIKTNKFERKLHVMLKIEPFIMKMMPIWLCWKWPALAGLEINRIVFNLIFNFLLFSEFRIIVLQDLYY